MTRTSWRKLAVPLSLLVQVVACGSSSGGSSGYSTSNCPAAGIDDTSACTSCMQSKCSDELVEANSECGSAGLSCLCPEDGRCSQSTYCTGAFSDLQSCASDCSSACAGDAGG